MAMTPDREHPITQDVMDSAISTTSFSKLRGFTLTVLEFLESEPMTSWMLVEKTGKPNNYVRSYLNRLRKYDLAFECDFFWFLTEKGELIYYLFKDSLHFHLTSNRTATEEQQKSNTCPVKKANQVSIVSWLRDPELKDAERRVVEELVNHYNKTQSKFFYCPTVYDIAERFHINPSQVNETLMSLKQDHIVYSIKDRAHEAYKIGLYKSFVEALEKSK